MSTFGPVEAELALGCAAAELVQACIHRFGLLGEYGVVCESNGSGVVSLDYIFRLSPTHLNKGLEESNPYLGGDEQGIKFKFSWG